MKEKDREIYRQIYRKSETNRTREEKQRERDTRKSDNSNLTK